MEFAVIKTGGKQYKVKKDDVLEVEKLDIDEDKKTKQTMVFDDLLHGKKVKAEFIELVKGKKIQIVKFKNKTRYTKRQGHRQKYHSIKIIDIL